MFSGLLEAITNGTLGFVLSFLFGTLIPIIFANWLPNSLFYNAGLKLGRRLSAAGRTIAGNDWEQAENNFTGSLAAFVTGVTDGANEDDAE